MSDRPAEKSGAAKPAGPTMEQRVQDLEAQLAATRAGLPGTSIPEHGAGPNLENWETWSQGEQEDARNGEYDEAAPTK